MTRVVGGGKARDFLAWFFPHNRIILIELDDDDGGEERDCDCQLWNVLILVARGLHIISFDSGSLRWVGGWHEVTTSWVQMRIMAFCLLGLMGLLGFLGLIGLMGLLGLRGLPCLPNN